MTMRNSFPFEQVQDVQMSKAAVVIKLGDCKLVFSLEQSAEFVSMFLVMRKCLKEKLSKGRPVIERKTVTGACLEQCPVD